MTEPKPDSAALLAAAAVARVRQMAHAWREQLPATIRTDTVVDALLLATDRAARLATTAVAPHGAPDGPPAPRVDPSVTEGENGAQAGTQRLRCTCAGVGFGDQTCRYHYPTAPDGGLRDRIAEVLTAAHREWMRPGSPERPMLDALTDAVADEVEFTNYLSRESSKEARYHHDRADQAEAIIARMRRTNRMVNGAARQADAALTAVRDLHAPTGVRAAADAGERPDCAAGCGTWPCPTWNATTGTTPKEN